jgi:uncharacterized membrane protein
MANSNSLVAVLALQLATLVAVIFNVFFARQVLAFVFLCFVPGYLLLEAFRARNLPFWKTAVYSIGVSLAFLMLFGLLLNTLWALLGFAEPLSTVDLVFLINLFTFFLFPFAYFQQDKQENQPAPKPPQKPSGVTIFLIALPFLTILGAELANFYSNTAVLMLLTAVVSIFGVLVFWRRLVPSQIFPFVLLSIAVFLLLGTSLASNYVVGVDVQFETYFARLTTLNAYWNPAIQYPYNGMLSVTVLPTVFSQFMNIDATWLFKIGYPIIYAFVPVALFLAYKKQTNAVIAFLAVFFFMSMDTFYLQMLGLARQMIAEVFFALTILLLVEDRLSLDKRRALFVVFGVGLIVSHYALGYIFMFFMLATLAFARFFKRPNDTSPPLITPVMAGGLILVALGWDLFVAPSAFNSLEIFARYVSSQIMSLAPVPGVSGLLPVYLSPLHDISKYLFLLLQGLIVVGVLGLFIRRKQSRFSREYTAMCIASFIILILTLLVPSFASAGLNVTRFYHVALFVLAPLCLTGATLIVGTLARIKNFVSPPKIAGYRMLSHTFKKLWVLLVAVLLVLFFLFQTGFVYELTNDSSPTSFALSKNRSADWTVYLHQLNIEPQEVSAAQWLSSHENQQLPVYADFGAKYLASYGMIPFDEIRVFDPALNGSIGAPAYFFFGSLNLQQDKVESYNVEWNMTHFAFITQGTDKIYSNGNSDIYYGK